MYPNEGGYGETFFATDGGFGTAGGGFDAG
jgi:hypothetical protein